MNTPAGIDPQMIANPPHYVKGRKIEPIQVIEEWSFCHHLACVVKYVARMGRKSAGRQNPVLEDLRKAEWYLMREIEIKACTCIPNPRRFSTAGKTIAKDWQLSASLSQVIFCLISYQRLFYRLPLAKVVYLEQALTHLRAEIRDQELKVDRNQDQQSTILGSSGTAHIRCGGRESEITINSQLYGTNIIIFKGGNLCNIQPK